MTRYPFAKDHLSARNNCASEIERSSSAITAEVIEDFGDSREMISQSSNESDSMPPLHAHLSDPDVQNRFLISSKPLSKIFSSTDSFLMPMKKSKSALVIGVHQMLHWKWKRPAFLKYLVEATANSTLTNSTFRPKKSRHHSTGIDNVLSLSLYNRRASKSLVSTLDTRHLLG